MNQVVHVVPGEGGREGGREGEGNVNNDVSGALPLNGENATYGRPGKKHRNARYEQTRRGQARNTINITII